MPERDANQLAADDRIDWAGTLRGHIILTMDGERKAAALRALDELVALVGTLQLLADERARERDETDYHLTHCRGLLDAAEAQVGTLQQERDEWHQIADDNLDRVRNGDLRTDELRGRAEAAEAALAEANEDLARHASALADALDHTECKGHCADGGCPFCGGVLSMARRALADTGGDTAQPTADERANPHHTGAPGDIS